jgi:hypothetical protein
MIFHGKSVFIFEARKQESYTPFPVIIFKFPILLIDVSNILFIFE